jgi:uncharacterized protein (DUF58 family)
MLKEFHYKIDWRTKSHLPGHHRSSQSGGGLEFRGNVPLLSAPDPRRLDIRASLSDPFDQWFVRSYRQRSQVPIYVVADLSASIGFNGVHRKLDILADVIESIAYSVHRTGDRFAFLGCDDVPRDDFYLAPTHSLGAGLDVARRLRDYTALGKSARGLTGLAPYLAHQRSLVFLISDFHFEDDLLIETLESMARHAVCPIVLWDRAEFERMPRTGIVLAQDSETGRRKTLLLRRSLRERLIDAFSSRRKHLNVLFGKHGTRPLFVEDKFDPERVTEYFYHIDALLETENE